MPAAAAPHPDFDLPWINAILSSPDVQPAANPSRRASGASGPSENSFFATTLATPSTIRACRAFYLRACPPASDAPQQQQEQQQQAPSYPTALLFVSLGPAGLDSWAGVAAGGVVATLLDETMGLATYPLYNRSVITREMRVAYRRPVPTGAVSLCRARVEGVEGGRGRGRVRVRGSIEDAAGRVLAEGEALFSVTEERL